MPALDVQAILFDLDGTLVDSTAAVDTTWRELAEKIGVPFAALHGKYHGIPSATTLRELLPEASSERIAELSLALSRRQAADELVVVAAPGAAALVDGLPVTRWAIATSADGALAAASLRRAQLPTPGVLITTDDVAEGKPAPEPYLVAARRLGVAASECLVAEDAPAGIASARAAGMRVVAVTSTHSAEELADADWIVADLRHLSVKVTDAGLHVEIATL